MATSILSTKFTMKGEVKTNLVFFLILFAVLSCDLRKEPHLFKLLTPDETGIDFNNKIVETDSVNMLTFTNIYVGGGIGVGDFNNDGLPDLFFGGNQLSSRLYLNKGDFKFEDITESAGVATDRWITGVSVVDINGDNYLDIYLSVSGPFLAERRKNLFFINNGDLTFSEKGSQFGVGDESQTAHGSFFDYDRDGDLDLYLILNPTDVGDNYPFIARRAEDDKKLSSIDKLYRNDLQEKGVFTDISYEAGIRKRGFSLAINTSDINNDGWVDVFVSNDFLSNDLLYINRKNGTFHNEAGSFLKHTSYASMGNDFADINNDGLQDFMVLDMFPENSYREKMLMIPANFNYFNQLLSMNYEPQYSRNVLQLNKGISKTG